MKQIDVRFSDQEMAKLQSMIGKKMLRYKGDMFGSAMSYGLVAVRFEEAEYAFTNFIEVMDYYGALEDVALFKLEQTPYDSIHSLFQNKVMLETPVDRVIRRIEVVNEQQRLYEDNVWTYEVLVTRGIIFFFEDGHELSLEKNIWFSEFISVEEGEHLIDRFSPASEFEEDWSDGFVGKCEREIITLQ